MPANDKLLNKTVRAQPAFYGLETAVCYLMTRFMRHPCPRFGGAIVHHLRLLAEHPNVQDESESSEVYGGLLQEWQWITTELLQQSDLSQRGQ